MKPACYSPNWCRLVQPCKHEQAKGECCTFGLRHGCTMQKQCCMLSAGVGPQLTAAAQLRPASNSTSKAAPSCEVSACFQQQRRCTSKAG
jgi:hypothetical protein